jgi:hypothetical protein
MDNKIPIDFNDVIKHHKFKQTEEYDLLYIKKSDKIKDRVYFLEYEGYAYTLSIGFDSCSKYAMFLTEFQNADELHMFMCSMEKDHLEDK